MWQLRPLGVRTANLTAAARLPVGALSARGPRVRQHDHDAHLTCPGVSQGNYKICSSRSLSARHTGPSDAGCLVTLDMLAFCNQSFWVHKDGDHRSEDNNKMPLQ